MNSSKNAFIFDFDSTLVSLESLDTIIKGSLKKKNKEDLITEVHKITDMGMEGEIDLKESIRRRMVLAEISEEDINEFKKIVVDNITPGIPELINFLRENNQEIFIISGGLLNGILPVAEKLEIEAKKCFANNYFTDEQGNLTGIDEENPLVQSNGKSLVINNIKKQYSEISKVFIIGDGISDFIPFEEKVADYFLGFGINKVREAVKNKSECFFTDMNSLQDFIVNFLKKDL